MQNVNSCALQKMKARLLPPKEKQFPVFGVLFLFIALTSIFCISAFRHKSLFVFGKKVLVCAGTDCFKTLESLPGHCKYEFGNCAQICNMRCVLSGSFA